MNGKRAKAIRREVYGKDGSTKVTKYHASLKKTIVADEKRQLYQRIKKERT